MIREIIMVNACYISKCFFRCLQDERSSLLEFNVAISGWRIMMSFSCKHRLHLFVLAEFDNFTLQ